MGDRARNLTSFFTTAQIVLLVDFREGIFEAHGLLLHYPTVVQGNKSVVEPLGFYPAENGW